MSSDGSPSSGTSVRQLVPFSPPGAVVAAPSWPQRALSTDAFHVAATSACPLCRRPFAFEGAVAPGRGAVRRDRPRIATNRTDDPDDVHDAPQRKFSVEYFQALPRPPASESETPRPETPLVGDPHEVSATEDNFAGGYYHEHFEEVSLIGRGSFGSVHVCRHVVGGEVVGVFAVKKVPVGDDAAYLRRVLSEVKILEQVCQHPNVIQYHHSWLDAAKTSDFGPVVRCLFILMEYAPHGSLEGLIERYGDDLTDDAVWFLFLSTLRGLRHLHDRGILHRDIKADNVLLSSNFTDALDAANGKPSLHASRPAPRPVLADFGTSGFIPHDLTPDEYAEVLRSRTGGTGTEEYMAPELLECLEASRAATPTGSSPQSFTQQYAHFHTTASDLYAMGVILHRLAYGGAFPMPISGGSPTSRIAPSPMGARRRPPEMAALISALLHTDPSRRPASCAAILEVPEVRDKWRAVCRLKTRDLTTAGNSRANQVMTGVLHIAGPKPAPQSRRNAGVEVDEASLSCTARTLQELATSEPRERNVVPARSSDADRYIYAAFLGGLILGIALARS